MSHSTKPPDELRARILAEIQRSPAPTRAEHTKRVVLIAGLGAMATTAIFFVMGGFARGTRPIELVAFTSGLALVAAIVLTRLSSGVTGSMLGRSRQALLLACVATAPALALAALAAAMLWPADAQESVAVKTHVACGVITVAQGALPLIAMIVPRRGSDPVHPAITGAALGMTAGAWTAMMAYLRCPHAELAHCVLAHVSPTLILTVVGAALGHAFLRIRSAR